MIKLSTHHSIDLASEYLHLLEKPPAKDYTLHTIYRKEANGKPLKLAELVIAGAETRKAIYLAEEYPVHFKKTYFPQSFYTDPRVEYDSTECAARLLDMPMPIGYEPTVFRNSFMPGKTWNRISPFGVTPEERNFAIARDLPDAQCIGLWLMLEQIYAQIKTLHANRFIHGDLQPHNVIVCSSPVRAYIIDYEVSVLEFEGSNEDWEKKRIEDLREFLKEALYVQSVLGQQKGDLCAESLELLPVLFQNPKSVLRRLKDIGVH